MLTRRKFLQAMGASAGLAAMGLDGTFRMASAAAAALRPNGSRGLEHVVVLMMENRSFDHFLGWLPGADGRQDMTYLSVDGNVYPNYPLAPDFQGCGYSDPDHSWEGWLLQHNFGQMNGFLLDPTNPNPEPGVKLAAANTFPIGYYTNLLPHDGRKPVPDLPVTGALAEHYTVLDRYFCSFAGETFPNRFYQHAARTDRDHNTATTSTLPTIWDRLSPVPNNSGVPTGGYFFRDLPFLGLWGTKYFPFWRPFAPSDVPTITDNIGIPLATASFLDAVAQGTLPNVSFVDPAFNIEGAGTSGDDHPLADIRVGERFIADTYHALATAGYLRNTALVVTFDEWGGFYEHVPPPQVIDDTDPDSVDHTGDSATPVDGQLIPNYQQLGFRVPAIVVSNLAVPRVVHQGPYEHTSTLALIESTFGLPPLTARDANANNLGEVLLPTPAHSVRASAIPTSSQVMGPVDGAAAMCSASSVQSVSPPPVSRGHGVGDRARLVGSEITGDGMVAFGRQYHGPGR